MTDSQLQADLAGEPAAKRDDVVEEADFGRATSGNNEGEVVSNEINEFLKTVPLWIARWAASHGRQGEASADSVHSVLDGCLPLASKGDPLVRGGESEIAVGAETVLGDVVVGVVAKEAVDVARELLGAGYAD